MTHDRLASDLLAHHGAIASSPSAHLLDELTTFAHRPLGDEPDPRPLPEPEAAEAALGTVVEALSGLLTGTRLEDELPDLLWSLVNLLHRKAEHLSRRLPQSRKMREHRGRRSSALNGQGRPPARKAIPKSHPDPHRSLGRSPTQTR